MLKATEIKENALQSQRLEGKMLKEHHHKVIKELHAKGIAKREIARTLGLDIKTVRRYRVLTYYFFFKGCKFI